MNSLFGVSNLSNVTVHTPCQVHSVCCCVPFYHTFGCAMGTLAALLHGARQVSPNPHFDPEACLRTMEADRSVGAEVKQHLHGWSCMLW